jgi:hypothetical protein
MKIQGVVEIAPAPLGEESARLLSSAYRASRSAVIMLVLDRVTLREADRYLDQVVGREGNDVQGVVYADVADERTVAEAARAASFVVASTDAFRRRLAAQGIVCEDAISWPTRVEREVPAS